MDLETRQLLTDKMYEVIQEEALPRPSRILIRQPTKGKQASCGKCIKSNNGGDFKLTITTTKPIYVLDENGRFFSKKDKNIRYKFMGWHDISRERLIYVVAHEIAHLKFWNHDAQHTSYTNHLISILTKKLESWAYAPRV